MKKIFFIATCFAFSQGLYAQEPADALRYSWYVPSGSARQVAIGGAMTSLGGDISATFVNPAGLGFYRTGDLVLSPGYNFLNNKSTYFGRTEKDKRNNFSIGTTGLVIGGGDSRENRKKSSAFAIAVNRTASFSSNVLYRGINNQSSYSQKFLEEIANNGHTDANLVASGDGNYAFGTSLALNTFWIDTANGYMSGNRNFVSLAAPLALSGGLIQEQIVKNRGGITEIAFGGAGNINDKWYFGGTLGIPILSYEKESSFSEADATTNTGNRFDFATINENLTTKGAGLNIKLGVIYKPVERIRLGLAIHSPTFFSLTDRYNSEVITDTEGFQGRMFQRSTDFTGGNDAEFKYWYFTPYRIMIGGSYVLHEVEDVRKQKGFLTADIEYVNYKASSFTTDPESDDNESTRSYLKSLNRAIDRAYKGALNFKVGGELKFTTIMVRLGAAYYGNPYKNLAGEKGSRFQLTGGLGYRNKGMFIDLGYAHTMGKDVHFAYRLQSNPFSAARIKNTGGNAVLTIGFKI
jgi:hypothetical protein